MNVLVARRGHIGDHAAAKGDEAWQVAPVNAQRTERIEQDGRQAREGGQVGDGVVVFGGEVSGGAAGCAAEDGVGVDKGGGNAALLQIVSGGEADYAAAEDEGGVGHGGILGLAGVRRGYS